MKWTNSGAGEPRLQPGLSKQDPTGRWEEKKVSVWLCLHCLPVLPQPLLETPGPLPKQVLFWGQLGAAGVQEHSSETRHLQLVYLKVEAELLASRTALLAKGLRITPSPKLQEVSSLPRQSGTPWLPSLPLESPSSPSFWWFGEIVWDWKVRGPGLTSGWPPLKRGNYWTWAIICSRVSLSIW